MILELRKFKCNALHVDFSDDTLKPQAVKPIDYDICSSSNFPMPVHIFFILLATCVTHFKTSFLPFKTRMHSSDPGYLIDIYKL